MRFFKAFIPENIYNSYKFQRIFRFEFVFTFLKLIKKNIYINKSNMIFKLKNIHKFVKFIKL